MLFVADLVDDLKDPRIASLPNLDTNSLVHFAVYDAARLAKLVVLNLDFYDGTPRWPSKKLRVGKILGQKLRVRRLTGGCRLHRLESLGQGKA